MKEYKTIEFEPSDFELLEQEIPEYPCNKCPDSFACLGCAKEREYQKTIAPYKDAGILEIAQDVTFVLQTKKKITRLQKEIDKHLKKIPEEVRETVFSEEGHTSELKVF